MINIALLILVVPLIGTFILLYLQNSSKKLTIIISNLSILLSFLLSIYLLFIYISSNTSAISQDVLTFADVKIYSLSFGLYIDSLSLVMCSVVTSVSFLVHYYCRSGFNGYESR